VSVNTDEGIESTSNGIRVDEDEVFNWKADHRWEILGGGVSYAAEFANASGTAYMEATDSGSAGAELSATDSDGNTTILT
jgi:hypothetical protein